MLTAKLPPILRLPLEVIQQALVYATPRDVASASQTCRTFREIIYSDNGNYLWKKLFLELFDDPRMRANICENKHGKDGSTRAGLDAVEDYRWRAELQRRIKARNFVSSGAFSLDANLTQRKETLSTFISVVETSLPAIASSLHYSEDPYEAPPSKNVSWIMNTLNSSNALNRWVWTPHRLLPSEMGRDTDEEELSLRSQLHSYIGFTNSDREIDLLHPQNSLPPSDIKLSSSSQFGSVLPQSSADVTVAHAPIALDLRARARERVYDSRSYIGRSRWGPIIPISHEGLIEASTISSDESIPIDYTIDWNHLEAIISVLMWNVFENPSFAERDMIPPFGVEALRPYSEPTWLIRPSPEIVRMDEEVETEQHRDGDWAGVEGSWQRVVSFCNYSTFLSYNVRGRNRTPDISAFQNGNFSEATRPRTATLRITSIDLPASRLNLRPRINFQGTEDRGIEGPGGVRGFVEEMPSGMIHWNWVSIIGERDSYVGEGVQLGGIGSRAGFVGIWSGIGHTARDPLGPFWMWKLHN